MKGAKSFYIQHIETITGILLLILSMLAMSSVVWWIESMTSGSPPEPVWLAAMIYDEDGKLEPLTHLIGLGGIISFLLNAVNRLSAERAFGILLKNVIGFVFSPYKAIMFWFYGFFLIFGGYCCKIDLGAAAVSCLCGLALCSVYGFLMCAQLSGENLDELVLSYMHWQCRSRLQHPFTGAQFMGSRTELHHFADYIFQQWQDNSALQMHRTGGADLEGEFVLGLMELLELPEEDPGEAAGIVDCFKRRFSCVSHSFCNRCGRNPGSWPLTLGRKCGAYRDLYDDVQECSMLWECLLRAGDASRQARLAGKMLASACIYAPRVFMPLACGLLSRLRFSGPSIAAQLENPNHFSAYITPRLDFLAMIVDGYRSCFLRGTEKPEIQFEEAWGQMAFLAVAMLEWLAALQWPSKDEIGNNIERIKFMLRSLTPGQDFGDSLAKQADTYSRCALTLLSFERPEILDEDMMIYVSMHQAVLARLAEGL